MERTGRETGSGEVLLPEVKECKLQGTIQKLQKCPLKFGEGHICQGTEWGRREEAHGKKGQKWGQ